MEKRILFRGVHKQFGHWAHGDLFHDRDGKTYIDTSLNEVFPESVSQYIFLEDMDNKEIFTGHILEDRRGKRYLVKISEGGFIAIAKEELETKCPAVIFESLSDQQNTGWVRESLRIVGDYFTNPELLY